MATTRHVLTIIDGTEYAVEVTVSEMNIANLLGPKALRSKKGRSVLGRNMVTVRVVDGAAARAKLDADDDWHLRRRAAVETAIGDAEDRGDLKVVENDYAEYWRRKAEISREAQRAFEAANPRPIVPR